MSALPAIVDHGFQTFAQIHLRADPHCGFPVGDAYATYAAFARRRGEVLLPRAQFGALLTAMARSVGGGRDGDRISALALKDAVPAPACEAVTVAPPVPPIPSAQRLLVPIVRDAHEAAVPAAPVRVASRAADPAPDAWRPDAAEGKRQGGDAVDRFLATRLVERPGFVVAVESLRKLVKAEGLRFADVVERAKARGHAVRKNAWGPDFLTDAQLVDAREAAE
jgi:hypothetical protein